MGNVNVLDCTLRDGGYCNDWLFGHDNITYVIGELYSAKVDYIECGYLSGKKSYNDDSSLFNDINQVRNHISDYDCENRNENPFLIMINYGEYDVEKLPECKKTCIGGIRVAFHKKDVFDALSECVRIKEKGYNVFVQPMISMVYSDDEFVELINEVNHIRPYAFYIVDSFGTMKKNDLIRFANLTEQFLDKDIILGFHAHNNMQLAYSNAQCLVEFGIQRELIVDVSIHGMGRGAGNLNAELFLDYLNEYLGTDYDVRKIIILMDDIVSRFYEEKRWGYSLPNYLSASHMIHPNYATFLDEKKTLSIEDVDNIFMCMDSVKKAEYDPVYIEQLYYKYCSRNDCGAQMKSQVGNHIRGNKVLLISPGQNAFNNKSDIIRYIKEEKMIVISVNHVYPFYEPDYVFVSNIRRFKRLEKKAYKKTIVTSNIGCKEVLERVDYGGLMNDVDGVKDNAGLMAINYAFKNEASEVVLAGYDGYSHDVYENFESDRLILVNSSGFLDALNSGMKQVLDGYCCEHCIRFLTKSRIIPEGASYI